MILQSEIEVGFRFKFKNGITGESSYWNITEVMANSFEARNYKDNNTRRFATDPTTLRSLSRLETEPEYNVDILPILGLKVDITLKDDMKRRGRVTDIQFEEFSFFGSRCIKPVAITLDEDATDTLDWNMIASIGSAP